MYSKVESEPKHEVAIIEREFKFRKKNGFFVLGSLRTVPLHSTLAINNLGLKFVRLRKFASVFEIVSNTGFKLGHVFNSFSLGF